MEMNARFARKTVYLQDLERLLTYSAATRRIQQKETRIRFVREIFYVCFFFWKTLSQPKPGGKTRNPRGERRSLADIMIGGTNLILSAVFGEHFGEKKDCGKVVCKLNKKNQ